MFPVTDSAKTIWRPLLWNQARCASSYECQMRQFVWAREPCKRWKLDIGEQLQANAVILADRRKIVSEDRFDRRWVQDCPCCRSYDYASVCDRVPLTSSEEFIQKELHCAIPEMWHSVSSMGKEKRVVTHQMDMIFTHFGVSGPTVLRCSSFVHQVQEVEKKKEVVMSLNALRPQLFRTRWSWKVMWRKPSKIN